MADASKRHGRTPLDVFTCGLNPTAITLYGWLSGRYGGYRAGVFPKVPTLAADLGWSERTVRRAVRDLTAAGWLTVTERPGTSNLYRLVKSPREAANLSKRRSAASAQVSRPDKFGRGGVTNLAGVG